MADIAGVVGTFLKLATEWYKNASARNTASATLLHHLRNLNQFQAHIKDPIDSLFRLYIPRAGRQRLDPLLLFQAVRVVHLNASLQDWLHDAGFRPDKRSEIVVVNQRPRGSTTSRAYIVKRLQRKHGQLRLPRFGVTSKEVTFTTLFERLEKAYEKVEAGYPDGAYRFIPHSRPYTTTPGGFNFNGPGIRGGFNSDVDGDSEDPDSLMSTHPFEDKRSTNARAFETRPTHVDRPLPRPAAPQTMESGSFYLTKRQQLNQEEMLHNLSQRLEHNIANMMISNGDEKKFRERQHMRRPLEKAQHDVLREKSLDADREDVQQVRYETYRAQQEARDLRSKRILSENNPADILEFLEHDRSFNFPSGPNKVSHDADYLAFENVPPSQPPKIIRLKPAKRSRGSRGVTDKVEYETERDQIILEPQRPVDVLGPMRMLQSERERLDEPRRLYTAEVVSVADSPQSSERDRLEVNERSHDEMAAQLREALTQEQEQRREDQRRHAEEIERLSQALLREQEQRERDQQRHTEEIQRLGETQTYTQRGHKAHRRYQQRRSPHASMEQRRQSDLPRNTSHHMRKKREVEERRSDFPHYSASHERHATPREADVHLQSQRVEEKRQSVRKYKFWG